MNARKMLVLAKNKVGVMILGGLLVAALSFFALVATQKNFRASADVLIVPNQSGITDSYTVSKSNDYLTNVLVQAMYSEKFINTIENSGAVSGKFLPDNRVQKLEEWKNMVNITRSASLGVIHIEVLNNDQKQIMEISNAIVATLSSNLKLFLGQGQNVDIRVLNNPLWESNPSFGMIAITVIVGFIVGGLIVLLWQYRKAEKDSKKLFLNMNSLRDEHIESLENIA